MKHFSSLLAFLIFVACNSSSNRNSPVINKYNDTSDMYYVESEDEGMNIAMKKAYATLVEFDTALKSGNPSFTDFAVKKRFNVSDGGAEHIWVAGLNLVDRGYRGFVNNDVEHAEGVKYGDSVFVSRNEVTDWMYLDRNVLKGGYTIREIRKHLNNQERAQMDSNLGFEVKD